MKYLEPFKSCSLFGALRYLANIKGSVSLINGPAGCAFFNRSSVFTLNGYFDAPERVHIPKIYCTDFNEKDVVFGGDRKLKEAALELIYKFRPKVLFIFNCCVTEVIGAEIDSIALELEQQFNDLQVVAVHSAGFKGDHRYGMKLGIDVLINNFIRPCTEMKWKKVNILGELDYFNRASFELIKKLNEININNICNIPGDVTIEEIMDSSSACLNIITCQNASRYLAEQMKVIYGIPFIGSEKSFYGLDNCLQLYNEIYDFFDADKSILQKEYCVTKEKIFEMKKTLKGTRAFIIAGTRRSVGYAAILKELEVEVEFIFSEADGKYINKDNFLEYSSNVMCNEYPDEISKMIKEKKPDFVLSTLPELVAPEAYLPRPQVDFSGFTGVFRMGEYLINAMKYGYETAYTLINN